MKNINHLLVMPTDYIMKDVLANIRPGYIVRVKIEAGHEHDFPIYERFWVTVSKVNTIAVTGIIKDRLRHSGHHGLNCGDIVQFGENFVSYAMPVTATPQEYMKLAELEGIIKR